MTAGQPSAEASTAGVRGVLAGHPGLLAAFEVCLGVLAMPGRAVAVTGSVARGSVDRYSDLDLVVVVAPGEDHAVVAGDVEGALAGLGEPLAGFRATHLGRPGLVVAYVELDGRVVKVDVDVRPATATVDAPEAVTVHGESRTTTTEGPDLDDLLVRAAGWTWFTHAKIMRGEYLTAARAIDFTREHALLPMLLHLLGLPQDGHRHVEARLPADELRRLYASHPARLERAELERAFDALNGHLLDVTDRLPPGQPRGDAEEARITRRVLALVHADRAGR